MGSSVREGKGAGIRLPYQVLLDLEEALNHPPYMGSPVGPTLDNLFQIELLVGRGDWGIPAVALDLLRYLRHTLLPSREGRSAPRPGAVARFRGRALFTWLHPDKPSVAKLVLPVLEQMGFESCSVVGTSQTMRSRLDAGIPFVTWEEMGLAGWFEWYPPYLQCFPAWNRSLLKCLRRHSAPFRIAPRTHYHLLCQTRRIASYIRFLREAAPAAIVTENDRDFRSSCLVLAARGIGIPTFTLLHGMLATPYGYTPLVADQVLCWGEESREKFIEFGVEPERVVVTGCQTVHGAPKADGREARVKVGLPPDLPVVLLATTPIASEPRRALFQAFCSGLSGARHLSAVVRLHPSEGREFYETGLRDYEGVRILENSAWTVDEALAAADIVVGHDTAFVLDALACQRPVVLLDAISEPLIGSLPLSEVGGCPRVKNAEQLGEVVDHLLSSPERRADQVRRAEKLRSRIYACFSDEAARRVAEHVRGAIARGRSVPAGNAGAH